MAVLKTILGSVALMLVSGMADPTSAVAQSFRFQYAAKFFCGENISGTSNFVLSALPGAYSTAVFIHNPQKFTVKLRKKIAAFGEVSAFKPGQLNADSEEVVNCNRILTDFGVTFIHGAEGFLVIESASSLDVNAAYTAGKTGEGGEVTGIAVEPVRERTGH